MASSQFSADTLSELLSAQTEPPSSDEVAARLISDVDSDGDGSLSLSEIETMLGSGSGQDAVSSAVSKLDADSDGKLSSAELSAALEAFKSAQGDRRPPAAGWTAQEVAA